MSNTILIESATLEDCEFIAYAAVMAERAHTGFGILDALLGDNNIIHENGFKCLSDVISTSESSHFYYKNFFIARNNHGVPVGTCCVYRYPDCTLYKTIQEVGKYVEKHLGWTKDQYDEHASKIDFLFTSWPEEVNVDDSCFLECVYTDINYRGQGISSALVNKCLEKAQSLDIHQCFIIPAVGNNAALMVYLKCGFVALPNAFTSEQCMAITGAPGFVILKRNI
jgi:GNAT superfamily N-acetyltransferase